MTKLSVLVPTRNEAANLEECLRSVAFADEIVVVDSESTDDTRAIAERCGARVLVHPFAGHAAQKNWGLERVTHDWVLILDADERATPELAREVREILASPSAPGYWIHRRNTFLGREIRGCGWQRDKVLRLFDRRHGRYEDVRVHEEVRLDAGAGQLREKLWHHSCTDLGAWLEKVDRYSTLGAEEAMRRGRRPRFGDLSGRPVARFAKQWLVQGGWRDGIEGWILCVTSAYSVFLKYAKLRRLEGRR
ncbi:MAG: glycosyltransferase family 2 protein [Gemmatimonadetes bacterium]|nr:glycosyltransferase family 2 protein [Gemmatimonadota bacterium]